MQEVIARERPDAIMLGFGGQTALDCGLELARRNVLQRFDVAVLGTPVRTIEETEDRARFVARLAEIGVAVPRSAATGSMDEAITTPVRVFSSQDDDVRTVSMGSAIA